NADSAIYIDAVDFDGDGDTDVVTAAGTSNQFAWYENDGMTPPGWTLRVIDSGATNADGATNIEAVDLDGDGDTDVVTAAATSDQFAWYEIGSHDVRQTAPPVVATVTSQLISFANFPASPSGWGTVTWNQGNVDGRITVEVLDSAGAVTGLSGTTTTTGLGSIDISSLAVTGATSCIRLRATLNDVDGAESGTSPQLADWTVTVAP
ncbi:MAG: VCBS repeat-containing protein, partial [Deltaproteobacteria bacterium]|nr:VCBS repeat-containing protein [Deltaproteobacteria bacterium]